MSRTVSASEKMASDQVSDSPAGALANTGPPVPDGQIQRMLQPFQRLSPDRVGEPGGSGLGLSIVAAIAKAHGAALSVRGAQHGGLDIEVTFAASATGQAGSRHSGQPALTRRR